MTNKNNNHRPSSNYFVFKDSDGRSIVIINDIRFRGKRRICANTLGIFMRLLTQKILCLLEQIFLMNSAVLTIPPD